METPTYQDWIARGTGVCDAECAQAMGWERSGRWWAEDGVTMAPAEDVVLALAWSPTVNRNDTARMVERVVELRRKSRFTDLLLTTGEGLDSSFMVIAALIAAPSLVAYCAWRALREEA